MLSELIIQSYDAALIVNPSLLCHFLLYLTHVVVGILNECFDCFYWLMNKYVDLLLFVNICT